jgi:methylmalonyl-CoA/ethylmalonyl-CoA epimerase
LHHIAFRVDNIKSALDNFLEKGYTVIDKEPRLGAGGCMIAFLHPKSTGGVLIELMQNNR